jgi:hypothetical protein
LDTIDNAKAKIQYKEGWGTLSIPSLARHLTSDQFEASSTSLLRVRSFSDESHDKSPSRTRSFRLTYDNLLVRTSSLRL